ncbi:MAG: TonB family protein [Candidatus Sulfotelmatobacter sp.]
MSTAIQVWEKWQGQTVDGKFPLRYELGGSQQSAVFLTERSGREPRQAAIKLIPAAGRDEEAQLARWAAIAKLDHPHLLRLFESGRCQLDGTRYLYVVMEYAEEDLAQVIPQRPLSPTEVSDVSKPLAEVLGYLHQSGFVHGRIKPSNILAVNNQLKISSDGLLKKGELLGKRKVTVYEAPEASSLGLSAEADVWSLGVMLVTTLTQYAPDFTNATPPQAIVPETVPQPFREIARRCLIADPRRRCTITEIQTRLQTPEPPAPKRTEAREQKVQEVRSSRRIVVPVAILIVLLMIVGAREFLTRRPAAAPADHSAQPAPATVAKPSGVPPSAETQQAKGTVRGQVSKQVLPKVSQSARNTITGRIKVNVRVGVNPSGQVSEATLVSQVESKYFARLALEAARQWSFTPARVDGRAVASEWILRFQFSSTDTQVFPTETRP